MPKFPYHPAASLLPRPTDQERANLKEDIAKFGIREPIEIYDGQIIDGITRYELGQELGIDMSSDFRTLDDHEIGHDPWDYSKSKNLRRRHLTPSQTAMVEEELRKFAQTHGSQTKAAAATGVSRRTLCSARTVLEKGAPEVVEAVKSGKVKASVAEAFVKAEPDKERQAAAMKAADPKEEVKRRISGVTEKETAGSEAEPDSLSVVQADLKDFEAKLRELARHGRNILGAKGNEITREWCGRYSLLTVIQPLLHVARTIANDMPVGGTPSEPKLHREAIAEAA